MTRTIDDLPEDSPRVDMPEEFILVQQAGTAMSWMAWNGALVPVLLVTFEGINKNSEKAQPATVVINVAGLPDLMAQLVRGVAGAYIASPPIAGKRYEGPPDAHRE